MKSSIYIVVVAVMIIATLSFYPVHAVPNSTSLPAVPLITIEKIGLGNKEFSVTEHFNPRLTNPHAERTKKDISISAENHFVSPIHDSITVNYSLSISKNGLDQNFPGPLGGRHLSIPPSRSYVSTISVSGKSSLKYITIIEHLPSYFLRDGNKLVNGTDSLGGATVYNLTLQYENNTFNLYLPGYVSLGGQIARMAVGILSTKTGYQIAYSFPLTRGNFSFEIKQVVSSSLNVSGYVMEEYQIAGFQNPILTNLMSSVISILIGGLIFALLIFVAFIYYRKK